MSNYTLELLQHIKEMVDFLYENYSSLSLKELSGDFEKRKTTERCLEIIGEATKKLPKEFTEKHPDIEWRQMAGMRDILIHNYDNVDYDVLWDVLDSKIPILKPKIDELIKNYS
ncbi:MAG TPA: HepT-like ribonuclease domain-containing protein [Gracilimonas sp.]|uniref:HepT-like ribonuclease domain-containing protein n=1 Tax=Gracilimonas sp. TaxID=1974203 RepID=UPI002D9C66C6|nr:HepT-like ribonuclease domain-containing protein [Gracilimonas sp.]